MEISLGVAKSRMFGTLDHSAIQKYVKNIDEELYEEFNLNGLSEKFKRTFEKRYFTYQEFLSLYDESIKEEEFHRHNVFIFLKIEVEHGYWKGKERIQGRKDYTNRYEKSESGYKKLLVKLGADRFFSDLRVRIPYKEMKKHMHVTGATGEGKSYFLQLLFYSQQKWSQKKKNNSLVLLDHHGDLAKRVKFFRLNSDFERFVYFAPSFKKGYVPVINPLQLEDKSLIDKATEYLVEAFDELVNDATLSGQMRTILTPCIYTLLEKGGADLTDLQKFMMDDEGLVELGTQSKIKPHADFFQNYFTTNAFKRTKTAIYTRIQSLLNSPKFYHMTLGKSTVNLKEALNGGKVVVFDLSGLGPISKEAFGRFVVAKIKSIASDRDGVPEKMRMPTFVYIDECQNYVTKSVEVTLTEMRKYGLHLVLAHQHVEQLGELSHSVLSNTNVKVVYRNHDSTLGKFSSFMRMSVNEMRENWKKYECYIKTGDRDTVKFKPSGKLLKEKYQLSKEEEEKLDAYLLKEYYKPIGTERVLKSKPVKEDTDIKLPSMFPDEDDF